METAASLAPAALLRGHRAPALTVEPPANRPAPRCKFYRVHAGNLRNLSRRSTLISEQADLGRFVSSFCQPSRPRFFKNLATPLFVSKLQSPFSGGPAAVGTSPFALSVDLRTPSESRFSRHGRTFPAATPCNGIEHNDRLRSSHGKLSTLIACQTAAG